jgi:hypothetical protein
VMGRRGRRYKQLLGELKEKRICWKLIQEALDRNLRRTSFEKKVIDLLQNRLRNQKRAYVRVCNEIFGAELYTKK